MSSPLPFPDRNLAASAETAGFVARRDEYSAQVCHRTDRLFWIRVEVGPPDVIRVSDMTLGSCTSAEAALALALAVEVAGKAHLSAFHFLDVAPLPGDFDRRMQEVRAVLGALAKARSRFVADWRMQRHDEKVDVLAMVAR